MKLSFIYALEFFVHIAFVGDSIFVYFSRYVSLSSSVIAVIITIIGKLFDVVMRFCPKSSSLANWNFRNYCKRMCEPTYIFHFSYFLSICFWANSLRNMK